MMTRLMKSTKLRKSVKALVSATWDINLLEELTVDEVEEIVLDDETNVATKVTNGFQSLVCPRCRTYTKSSLSTS